MKTRNLLLSVLLAGTLGLVACNENPEPAAADPKDRPVLPEQQFFDYVFTETNAGVKQWVLKSDEMQKFAGQRDVVFSVVTMDFFNEGQHYSTLTADSGTGNMDVRDVHVWGNVVVVKENGDRLETEELYYDNESQLIHNEIFNRMTSADDVVTGIGLEATPDLEYIMIKERMRGDVADETAAREGAEPASSSPKIPNEEEAR